MDTTMDHDWDSNRQRFGHWTTCLTSRVTVAWSLKLCSVFTWCVYIEESSLFYLENDLFSKYHFQSHWVFQFAVGWLSVLFLGVGPMFLGGWRGFTVWMQMRWLRSAASCQVEQHLKLSSWWRLVRGIDLRHSVACQRKSSTSCCITANQNAEGESNP